MPEAPLLLGSVKARFGKQYLVFRRTSHVELQNSGVGKNRGQKTTATGQRGYQHGCGPLSIDVWTRYVHAPEPHGRLRETTPGV